METDLFMASCLDWHLIACRRFFFRTIIYSTDAWHCFLGSRCRMSSLGRRRILPNIVAIIGGRWWRGGRWRWRRTRWWGWIGRRRRWLWRWRRLRCQISVSRLGWARRARWATCFIACASCYIIRCSIWWDSRSRSDGATRANRWAWWNCLWSWWRAASFSPLFGSLFTIIWARNGRCRCNLSNIIFSLIWKGCILLLYWLVPDEEMVPPVMELEWKCEERMEQERKKLEPMVLQKKEIGL